MIEYPHFSTRAVWTNKSLNSGLNYFLREPGPEPISLYLNKGSKSLIRLLLKIRASVSSLSIFAKHFGDLCDAWLLGWLWHERCEFDLRLRICGDLINVWEKEIKCFIFIFATFGKINFRFGLQICKQHVKFIFPDDCYWTTLQPLRRF